MNDNHATSDSSADATNRPLPAWWGLLLAVLTVLAYLPVLQAGYIWDDDDYITDNPAIQSAGGLIDLWLSPELLPQYYPLVHTTFWLEYRLWGLDPAGYHAVNVLLHAATAVLVWRLLAALGMPGAWMAAAVFALHPVHVESVAWVTERKNVLSGCLALGSALCYVRWSGFNLSHIAGAAPRASSKLYVVSLLLFAAALFSKTVVSTLPAALLLLIWWKRGRISRNQVLSTLPMFALSIPLGLLTASLERSHVGAWGPDFEISLLERFLIASRAVWFYASKLCWPANLAFNYPRWNIDVRDAWMWISPAMAAILLAVLCFGQRRWGRGPLAAALYFGGTLFPALGFFNVYPMRYSFVADHFQYLASLGPIALFAAACSAGLSRWESSAMRNRSPGMFLCPTASLLLAALMSLTFAQSAAYRTPLTLWTDTLRKNPDSWLARVQLGVALNDSGKWEAAAFHLQQATSGNPDAAVAYYNLAAVLLKLGKLQEAEQALRSSVAAAVAAGGPNMPSRAASAHVLLGRLLAATGQTVQADEEFRSAVQRQPDALIAWQLLVQTSELLGKPDQAAQARQAVERLRNSRRGENLPARTREKMF